MATLSRKVLFYIDGARYGGLDAILDGTTSVRPSNPPCLMAGDKCPLEIYFRQRATDNADSTYLDLAAGSTLVVAGKAASGSLLFSSSGFTASGAGTAASCMVGTINLATAEIEAALAAVAYGDALDISIDFEVSNVGATEILTYRGAARLYKQVYSGETAPSPLILPPLTLTSPDGGTWQIGVDNFGQTTWTKVL